MGNNNKKIWNEKAKKNSRCYLGKSIEWARVEEAIKQIEIFKSDAIILIHAPFGILDFDGIKKSPKENGYLHLKLLGAYPSSLGKYASNELGVSAITIGLPYAGIMPSKKQTLKIWIDLIRWLKDNIKSKH